MSRIIDQTWTRRTPNGAREQRKATSPADKVAINAQHAAKQ
ncbi:hypothetical protein [Nonomuraea fuscirosea]